MTSITQPMVGIDRSALSSLSRVLKVIPAAAGITGVLFYAMQAMISSDAEPIVEPPPKPMVDIYIKEAVINDNYKTLKPERIEEPTPPPAQPQMNVELPEAVSSGAPAGMNTVKIEHDGVQFNMDTGGAIPHMQVSPKYPSSAIRRGIEGYVDVQFDVTAYGATTNIRVIRSEPEGVFERSALKAVERWKYKPMIADGKPVVSRNQMDRIRFKLEK